MRYTAIIFDLFGVVCSEVAPFWLPRHLTKTQALDVKRDLVGAADRGDVSQDELFFTLSRLTNVPADRIEQEWLALARIDDRMVHLLKRLRPTFSIGLLTNSPAPFVRTILETNGLSTLFDVIVVSSEVRIAKPDIKAYETILRELKTAPSQTLMIDDNPANADGAVSAGMTSVLFRSYEQLIDDSAFAPVLRALGSG